MRYQFPVLGHKALYELWRTILPARGYGVHHAAQLHGGNCKVSLAKGEVGQGPVVIQTVDIRKVSPCTVEPPAKLLLDPKAQLVRHAQHRLAAHSPGRADKVAVAGLLKGLLQAHRTVGLAVIAAEHEPSGVYGAGAVEGL